MEELEKNQNKGEETHRIRCPSGEGLRMGKLKKKLLANIQKSIISFLRQVSLLNRCIPNGPNGGVRDR